MFSIYITAPLPKALRSLLERGKIVSEPVVVDDYKETVFRSQQGSCTDEFTVVVIVTVCVKSVEAQAKPEQILGLRKEVVLKSFP